jgi:RND family efflux transporter MFP subunit
MPRFDRASLLAAFAAAAVLSLSACGGEKEGGQKKGERSEESAAGALPVRKVRLAHAEEGNLARTFEVTGTLAADEQVELGFKVTGRIDRLAVDLGTPVRAGQALAQLSPTDFNLRVAQAQNALEQARALLGLVPGQATAPIDPRDSAAARQATALLEQARLQRERMKSLFDQQLISRSDMDAAEASFQVAEGRLQDAIEQGRNRQAVLAQRKSELDLARQQLTDSTLRAPFDGVIRERRASPGDYVTPGQPVVVLVKVHPLRLKLAVPEREASGIAPGQTVHLTVEGDPTTYEGKVARTSPAITEDNRTYMVEAEVPNPQGRLRPGAFARAEIVTEADARALLVPADAVVTFAGVDKVLSVADGKAVEKRIKIGRRVGDRVEIVDGISAGDAVVLKPGNLVTGQPVEVGS